MISNEQIEYLLPKAYNAALRAGQAIMEIYNGRTSATEYIELKDDMSPITVADRNAHSVIQDYLTHTRIPLLSEEGREMRYAERRNWDFFWMIDPLDGTKEFIKGNGEFTVNISLIVNNRPCLGVIYVPNKCRIYFSVPGTGAFRKLGVGTDSNAEFSYHQILDGAHRLPLTNGEESFKPVVAVSRSHNNPQTIEHVERFRVKYPDCEILEQGSSYKLCLLAEGSIDYYPRLSPTYEWDTAAGEAILRNAGGVIRSIPCGGKLFYNSETLLNPHFECFSDRMIGILD